MKLPKVASSRKITPIVNAMAFPDGVIIHTDFPEWLAVCLAHGILKCAKEKLSSGQAIQVVYDQLKFRKAWTDIETVCTSPFIIRELFVQKVDSGLNIWNDKGIVGMIRNDYAYGNKRCKDDRFISVYPKCRTAEKCLGKATVKSYDYSHVQYE